MPPIKAQRVYGLLLVTRNKVLYFLREPDGSLTLPDGPVAEGEEEQDAVRRHVRVQTGYVVRWPEQVGGLHVVAGVPAKAYDCPITDGPAAAPGDFLTMAEALPLLRDPVMRRMALDAYSIAEEPALMPNELPEEFLPVEGIFLSDDGLRLVKEAEDGRREWRRLDPDSPTGFLQAP